MNKMILCLILSGCNSFLENIPLLEVVEEAIEEAVIDSILQ